MSVLMSAAQFVAACLLVGLGVFAVMEAAPRLHSWRAPAVARDIATVLGGMIIIAAAGGYWVSVAAP